MNPESLLPRPADYSSDKVISLCEKLSPGTTPVISKIESHAGTTINECFPNVSHAIEKDGGEVQYGWQIWETLPGVMIEAEFHAVWVDPDGGLHDITQKAIPTITRILFLPDQTRIYQGRQIDNVRIPLKEDALIAQFIKNAEQIFEESNKGDLADYHGELLLTPYLQKLYAEKGRLEMGIVQKFYL